jgi:hypothetical protein
MVEEVELDCSASEKDLCGVFSDSLADEPVAVAEAEEVAEGSVCCFIGAGLRSTLGFLGCCWGCGGRDWADF